MYLQGPKKSAALSAVLHSFCYRVTVTFASCTLLEIKYGNNKCDCFLENKATYKSGLALKKVKKEIS